MKFSKAYLRKRKKPLAEPGFSLLSGINTQTRTIPFAQLLTVVAEAKAEGKTIVAMQWDRNTYTVTIRKR